MVPVDDKYSPSCCLDHIVGKNSGEWLTVVPVVSGKCHCTSARNGATLKLAKWTLFLFLLLPISHKFNLGLFRWISVNDISRVCFLLPASHCS